MATVTVTRPPLFSRPRSHTGVWSWITTVDHKRIGILYGFTAFGFFLIGGFEALLIRAQQVLSTSVRDVRRRTVSVTGTIERTDGTRIPIGPETLTDPPETALRFMAAASVSLAAALLVLRFF